MPRHVRGTRASESPGDPTSVAWSKVEARDNPAPTVRLLDFAVQLWAFAGNVRDWGIVVSRPPGRGSALTADERREIQRLSIVEGRSIADISRRTDRDRGTVAAVLQSGESQTLRNQMETDAREDVLLLLRASSR